MDFIMPVQGFYFHFKTQLSGFPDFWFEGGFLFGVARHKYYGISGTNRRGFHQNNSPEYDLYGLL
jgi:hypothetical protein